MKLNTIKKNVDFKRVYQRAKSTAGAFIVLYKMKSSIREPRFGITVSKKVGKAVKRNRVRRLIKEAIISHYHKFDVGYDYVFVARVRANQASLEDIEKNLRYLLAKTRKQRRK